MSKLSRSNKPVLVVGQGIAGTLLSFFLLENEVPFKVIDSPLPGSSSKVAAGIINPITGRRLVKSWKFDQLFPFAANTYARLESLLEIQIFQERNILRALQNTFEQNEWDRRSAFPENAPFLLDSFELDGYKGKVTKPHGWGELTGAAKVDFPLLIEKFRQFITQRNQLIEEVFDFQKLAINGQTASYEGEEYSKIIFCEGANAVNNPFFKYLPFSVTKGELLLVKIAGLKVEKLLKHQIYVVPLLEDTFWVGSTNSLAFEDHVPTKSAKDYLVESLNEILDSPFEVLEHHAGIRPTTSDKRPILGSHPSIPQLAMFNGLGTKGASLGPFFADHMVNHLVHGAELLSEVDISRFTLESQ